MQNTAPPQSGSVEANAVNSRDNAPMALITILHNVQPRIPSAGRGKLNVAQEKYKSLRRGSAIR